MADTTQAKLLMEKTLKKRRLKDILSPAHNEIHSINVARYGRILAERIAVKEGFDAATVERAAALAEVSGYLHDIVRLPHEDIPHGVESAKWVAYASSYLAQPNLFWGVMPEDRLSLSKDELATVAFAIIQHEKKLNEIIRLTNFGFRSSEKAIVAVSLKIADVLFECSGFHAVERRCFFSGNERLHYGDLQFLKEATLTKEKPYLWAVLGETMIRLYTSSPLRWCPKWLESTATKLHSIQYRFYSNLVRLVAPDVPADELVIAHLLRRINFPRVDEKLIETVKKERHLTSTYWNKVPEIKEAISASQMDHPKMLLSLMKNVSAADCFESAYEIWKKAMHLNYFAHGIVDYNEGGCDYAAMAAENYTPYR
ncbi:MAG: HD domain-containing protein [Candidatus Micrarchaeota archaeon]|nr:HD domain-containing protein [Candidatus Micrarchaeota archaeon]